MAETGTNENSSRLEAVHESPTAHTDDRPILFLNPGHGNEPYILATAIGREVSKKFAAGGMEQPLLVLPLLYGDRQRRILLEENPNDADLIHLDEDGGKILQEIMFGSGDFTTHLAQVNAHYNGVEKMLQQRYGISSGDITTHSLAIGEKVAMSPRNIIGAIDVGNRVSLKTPHRYFAFPELLSRLLHESIQHPELGFSESDMKKLAARMMKVEATYSQVYIPWVNPFSYQKANLEDQSTVTDGQSVEYTPPMKSDIEKTEGQDEGVYIMFSGTGSAVEANQALVQAAHNAGIKAYSPPWENLEGTDKASPSIMADRNMLAILGRSGWGTGWQAMQLELPWLVAPYQQGDDPEIFFNNKTIEALRLGKVIGSEGITGEELRGLAESISPGLHSLRNQIRQKFGTTDGIDYISSKIFEDLTHSK